MSNNSRLIDLLIEVKCSRRDRFPIKKRDLEGLYSQNAFGFLAVLITTDKVAGPHWAFIPIVKIHPHTYSAKTLGAYKSQSNCLKHLDHLWGEVLMNEPLIDGLLNMPNINFKSMEWWRDLPFSPTPVLQDAVRKIKVAEALQCLREKLDAKYKRYASRREGFLHQSILCFCLNKLGWKTVSNHSGVPDLRTQLRIDRGSPDDTFFS